MPTPFIPNDSLHSGSSLASFADTMSVNATFAQFEAGDLLIVGIATDGTIAAVDVGGTFGALAPIKDGTLSDVTWSIWATYVTFTGTGLIIDVLMSASFDDAQLNWAIIKGAVAPNPFDPNTLSQAVTEGTVVTYTTSYPNDLLLFFQFGHNDLWVAPPPVVITPSTWQYVTSAGNSGGFGFIGGSLYALGVSTPQTNETVNSTSPPSGDTFFVVLAVTGNSAPTGGGVPVTLTLPPPISCPCVQPCAVTIDPGSHAYGMYYGSDSVPDAPEVNRQQWRTIEIEPGITIEF